LVVDLRCCYVAVVVVVVIVVTVYVGGFVPTVTRYGLRLFVVTRVIWLYVVVVLFTVTLRFVVVYGYVLFTARCYTRFAHVGCYTFYVYVVGCCCCFGVTVTHAVVTHVAVVTFCITLRLRCCWLRCYVPFGCYTFVTLRLFYGWLLRWLVGCCVCLRLHTVGRLRFYTLVCCFTRFTVTFALYTHPTLVYVCLHGWVRWLVYVGLRLRLHTRLVTVTLLPVAVVWLPYVCVYVYGYVVVYVLRCLRVVRLRCCC